MRACGTGMSKIERRIDTGLRSLVSAPATGNHSKAKIHFKVLLKPTMMNISRLTN